MKIIENRSKKMPTDETDGSVKLVFDEFYPALCFFAEKLIANRANAQDVVEDVFLKLWERKADFDRYNNIKAVLYRSVKNACINHIKKRNRDLGKQHAFNYIFKEESEDFILNEITRSEILREIHAELQKLPLECRNVMRLYFVEGWDYQKIADHLHISISTARNHKSKGLRVLRKKFGIAILVFISVADFL